MFSQFIELIYAFIFEEFPECEYVERLGVLERNNGVLADGLRSSLFDERKVVWVCGIVEVRLGQFCDYYLIHFYKNIL